MKNPFKAILEKRKEKNRLKAMQNLTHRLGLIERLLQCSLLVWDDKRRRLYISEPVATVMLDRGADGWQNFIRNVGLWTVFHQQSLAWDKFVKEEEQKAVETERRKKGSLTLMEIDRIKRACRDSIGNSEIGLPSTEPFEFFIIADNASVVDKEMSYQIIAVGRFDPENDEMAMSDWDLVQQELEQAKAQKMQRGAYKPNSEEKEDPSCAPQTAPADQPSPFGIDALIAKGNQ